MTAPQTSGTDDPSAERRLGPDRRHRPTPMLSRYWLRGRRRGGRRDGETVAIYVDRYAVAEWLLVTTILTFSVSDLALTWLHLRAGGAEANPILAWVLERLGGGAFCVTKLSLTAAPLLALLLHVRFRGVRPALAGLVSLYGLVIVWHAVVALDRQA